MPELSVSPTEKILRQYIPEAACATIARWINYYQAELKITKGRASKLGDYRHPYGTAGHRISVNHNLNPYSFLITLVHEFAHLVTWEKHRNKVKPHGEEWKEYYRRMMIPFLEMRLFPEEIDRALIRYMQDPAASSCTDVNLQRLLKSYDPIQAQKPTVEQVPMKGLFNFRNRIFRKEEKVRKRYKCLELSTKKMYLFSPLAEVTTVEAAVPER